MVFREVADQLSFRKAAEELYLTQPAVSLQIKALEEDVGVQLFDRTGAHITLTAVGMVLRNYCEQVGTSLVNKSKARVHWPWFILLFSLAAVANTYVHAFQAFYPVLKHLGVVGLTATLFLIGTGISKRTLQETGVRPLVQGIILWIVVATGSLALIRSGWIHL